MFGGASRRGCFFHYTKAIGLNAAKIGLKPKMKTSKRLRKLVRLLASVPLLPTVYIIDGVDFVIQMAEIWELVEEILPLITYWQRTWMKRIEHLSVSGCPDRTSNICESDNRMLQDDVKQKHPSIWFFLGK